MVTEFTIFIIKSVGVSAILWIVYLLLFHRKAKYLSQRIFMVSIPVIALLAALVTVDVIKVKSAPLFESTSAVVAAIEREFVEESYPADDSGAVMPSQTVVKADTIPSQGKLYKKPQFFVIVVLFIYFAVVVALIARYVIGYLQIRNIRRLATKINSGSYTIYKSGLIKSPFTYMRSIYISREIDGEKLSMILRHEMSHVNCNHYIDKVIIEVFSILLWFNPFVWRIAKQLSVVHEFEADKIAVGNETNNKAYKQYIFDELITSHPVIASGFNSSQVRERLLELKNGLTPRMRVVRSLVTIPMVVLLLLLTSFTYTSQEVVETLVTSTVNSATETISDIVNNPPTLPQLVVADNESDNQPTQEQANEVESAIKESVIEKSTTEKSSDNAEATEVSEVAKVSEKPETVAVEVKEAKSSESKTTTTTTSNKVAWFLNPEYQILMPNQYDILVEQPKKFEIYVVRHDTYTQVDMIIPIYNVEQWMIIPSQFYLEEPKSGDKYMLYHSPANIPFDRTIIFRNLEREVVRLSFVFPPLEKGIDEVIISTEYNNKTPRPSSTIHPWGINKVRVLSTERRLPYYEELQGEIIRM